jgi:hypothetical protein
MCTGKRTKKRTLKMKDNLWLEFPCKNKGSYGIKIWESGGSWSRPKKWHEQDGSKLQSHYQEGGVVPCVPCVAAVIGTGPIGVGIAAVGACGYGAKKGYDYYNKCKSKKKSKKKGKSKDKKKGKKKGKGKKTSD